MRKFILLSLLQLLMGKKKKKYYRRSPDDIFVYDRNGREIFRQESRPKVPNLFRYAKYAAVALVLITLTVGGLAVWGVVSAINYAGAWAQKAPIAEQFSQGEEKLRAAWKRPAAEVMAESKAKLAQIANQPLNH